MNDRLRILLWFHAACLIAIALMVACGDHDDIHTRGHRAGSFMLTCRERCQGSSYMLRLIDPPGPEVICCVFPRGARKDLMCLTSDGRVSHNPATLEDIYELDLRQAAVSGRSDQL